MDEHHDRIRSLPYRRSIQKSSGSKISDTPLDILSHIMPKQRRISTFHRGEVLFGSSKVSTVNWHSWTHLPFLLLSQSHQNHQIHHHLRIHHRLLLHFHLIVQQTSQSFLLYPQIYQLFFQLAHPQDQNYLFLLEQLARLAIRYSHQNHYHHRCLSYLLSF